MRILLFGGNGQVGHAMQSCVSSKHELITMTRKECDLTLPEGVREIVRRVRPDAIVNAAAYTAVDKAESDRDACYAVNAMAPGAMAQEAAALGARLIHYSTDYVFDGSKAGSYTEQDPVRPRNVYGASKLAGEQAIAASGAPALVLRTSWVYSSHGANFLRTMLRLGLERPELRVVADQRGAPTSAGAIAEATVRLLDEDAVEKSGVYHMTAGGETTWHGFAEAIFARAGERVPTLVPITTAEYPTPAARPANSVLSNDKFAAAFGFRLPAWDVQLDRVMAERAVAR